MINCRPPLDVVYPNNNVDLKTMDEEIKKIISLGKKLDKELDAVINDKQIDLFFITKYLDDIYYAICELRETFIYS